MSRLARGALDAAVQVLLAVCFFWSVGSFLLFMMSATGGCDGPGPNQIGDLAPPVVCLAFTVAGVAGSWGCYPWLRHIRRASRGPAGFDVLPPRLP